MAASCEFEFDICLGYNIDLLLPSELGMDLANLSSIHFPTLPRYTRCETNPSAIS
jgi:hypothetical protein